MRASRFIVWGSAGHAKVLYDLILDIGGTVCCLVDNNPAAAPAIRGVPLVHGEAGLRNWLETVEDQSNVAAAVAIGGARGIDRRTVMDIFSRLNIPTPTLIHPRAGVSRSSQLGSASQILAHSIVAADCSIGRAVIVNHAVTIDHECTVADGAHIAPGATLCGCISVGRDAFIGAGATVLPRIQIGDAATVGAGAVVTRNVAPGSVVVGVPARVRRV